MAKNKNKNKNKARLRKKRERERSVDVELEAGGTVKIVVKKPTNQVNTESQRVGAKVWTDCIRDGIMTKKELEKVMYKTGVWDKKKDVEQEEIVAEIHALEKKLYLGKKGRKMKVSEAKEIAIDMRGKRIELRDLLSERIELESNTAESLSDNAKFDFLVANCTFYEDGRNVYNSLEEYNHQSEDQIAFNAAANLAEMMYSVDKDFEKSLPENQFLVRANLVNEDLSLINKSGDTVDLEGNVINERGEYVDDEGNRIDIDGNALDDKGNYVPQVAYTHDNGKALKLEAEEEEEPKPEDAPESEDETDQEPEAEAEAEPDNKEETQEETQDEAES